MKKIQKIQEAATNYISDRSDRNFIELYNHARKIVFGAIYTLMKRSSRHVREDILQEAGNDAIAKMWEKIDTYDQTKASFSTWLYTITYNNFMQIYREPEMNRYIYFDTPTWDYRTDTTINIDKIELNEKQAPKYANLSEILEKLEDKELKRLLILKFVKGYTYQQLAEIYQTNTNTLKTRISRAKLKLKRIVEKEFKDYDIL